MKLFYITILCAACCVHGKFLPVSFMKRESPDPLNEDAPKSVTVEDEALTPNEKSAEMVQHPKLIVTLVANSRNLDDPSPFYMDPFQRFLQLFLSPFIRDLSHPVVMRQEDHNKEKPVDPFWASLREELKVNNQKNSVLRKEKEVNSSELDRVFGCEHGVEGFCKDCHPIKKRGTVVPTDISSSSVGTSTCSSETSTQSTVEDLPKSTKHKRHYFLFVSGDTEKRVTAPYATEQPYTRVKRIAILDTHNPNLTKEEEQLSIDQFKIRGGSAKRTTSRPKATSRGLTYNDTFVTNEVPFDFTPARAEATKFMTYFLLITVPMGCVLGGVIIFLCVFLRTTGWCCSLFLKDSARALEELTAKEAKKMMRKQFNAMAKQKA